MTKLLRTAILISVLPALAFARGGGGHGGGGGARSGGGGIRSGGGGGGVRSGGGSISRSGGVRLGGNGFRGNTFTRGGGYRYGNTRGFAGGYYGGRSYYTSYYGFGYGYPSYYSSYYPYGYDPYYDNGYYDGGYYDNGYYVNTVRYAPQAPPAAPTVINQTIGTSSASTGTFYRAADYYLIAFSDHTIRAAISYIVDGDQIRYTTREHEEKTAPLASVDVRFSEQINRDRRVEFRLP